MNGSKILLVLGAGPNIGRSLAQRFKEAGYKVALVSRSANDGEVTPDGFLMLQADLSKPSSIPTIFETVFKQLGGHPTVVVYNTGALTIPEDLTNIFSVPIEKLEADLAVMNTSAYLAARQAVAGFENSANNDAPNAFIYTGNNLSVITQPVPRLVTLGSGKSAASYWVGVASKTFRDKGYRFFFADERQADGSSLALKDISGPGAAEFYLKLAENPGEVPWHATFVAGKGYVNFPGTTRP